MSDKKMLLTRGKWATKYRMVKEDAIGVKIRKENAKRSELCYSIDDTVEYPVHDSNNPNGLYSEAYWRQKGRGIKDDATGVTMWCAYKQYFLTQFYSFDDTYSLPIIERGSIRIILAIRSKALEAYTKTCKRAKVIQKEQANACLEAFLNEYKLKPRVFDIIEFDDTLNSDSGCNNAIASSPIKRVSYVFNPILYSQAIEICEKYDISIHILLRGLIEDYSRSEISSLIK